MAPLEPIIIYAIPSSQFVFKVLAALQSRNIPHYVVFVPVADEKERRKVMPSGGSMSPEMKVGTGDDAIVVSDSEKILHWLDEHYNAKLFPSPEASELSERASNQTLASMVWYYNAVNKKGYQKSIQTHIRKAVFPTYVPEFLGNAFVDYKSQAARRKERQKVLKSLPGANEALLEDEDAMYQKLLEELKFFQALLQRPDQKYLLNTKEPTAADFSVYAQVARLMAGGSNDSEIPACAPPALADDSSLDRLWQWYELMKSEVFVKFKGKRKPKDL